ncbi:MAG: NUDIX domain-containing protein [Gemmatimonadales bacterium]|jgi:mutator protein MutT|nr:MAG: NUDIX domain-containing protein [Gemmatimonadales bacterium]
MTALDMVRPVDVVAAVLRDPGGRLFIAQRPRHKRHGGLWEFPGGKVHSGETRADAVARELQEELGLTATWIADAPLFSRLDPGQPFRIVFLEAEARGVPVLHEHQAVAWVPVPVPVEYVLAPTDTAFAAALSRGEIRLRGKD